LLRILKEPDRRLDTLTNEVASYLRLQNSLLLYTNLVARRSIGKAHCRLVVDSRSGFTAVLA
jgi:hypothetical protein